jgi:hypothetical protein
MLQAQDSANIPPTRNGDLASMVLASAIETNPTVRVDFMG